MIEKAQGPVKFVDCHLKHTGTEEAQLLQRIKHLFKAHGISQFSFQDWVTKREIRFEAKINERKIRFTVKGFQKDCGSVDKQVLASKILKAAAKEQVVITNVRRKEVAISSKQIASDLLVPRALYKLSHELKPEDFRKSTAVDLLKLIKEDSVGDSRNVYAIDVPPIQLLNQILRDSE